MNLNTAAIATAAASVAVWLFILARGLDITTASIAFVLSLIYLGITLASRKESRP